MKKFFLSATAVLFGFGAFAQAPLPLGYGVKAGVNLPNYHLTDVDYETKSSTNFHITAYLDIPMSTSFYFQPALSLQGKGAKLADFKIGGTNYEVSQNTMWAEVPLNFVAKLQTGDAGNFFIGAGPYVAVGISGKNKFSGGDSSADWDFKFGKDETQKGFDAGANFLLGYELSSGLTLGAGYGLGLMDIAPDNNSSIKQNNRVLSFSIGFAL